MSEVALRSKIIEHAEKIQPLCNNNNTYDNSSVDQWMELAAVTLKAEIIPTEWRYSETREMLRCIGPSLIQLPGASPLFLAVLKGGKRRVKILGPDLEKYSISREEVLKILTAPFQQAAAGSAARILERACIPEERIQASLQALVDEQLSNMPIQTGCWILRASPGESFHKQVLRSSVLPALIGAFGAHTVALLLMICSWWLIGKQALAGHFTYATVTAWSLILFTIIPFQLLDKWLQGLISIKIGELFKQRLLHGILQLEPEEIRHQGSGQFLGIIMEAESLSALALEGGLGAGLAVIQLIIATGILFTGAGGLPHAALLALWSGLTAYLCLKYYHRSKQWITAYQEMSNDMIEGMIGYRTRLVQEEPTHWHDQERTFLQNYVRMSNKLDSIALIIRGLLGRGWYLVGLLGILPSLLAKSNNSDALAISIAGILLAAQALAQLISGATSAINALTGSAQVLPLFNAATRSLKKKPHVMPSVLNQAASSQQHPVVSFQDATFCYPGAALPALSGCTGEISANSRILLQGPSGGGKSSLAGLLTGLRSPESGQLRLWGIDHKLVGPDLWRTKAVAAPQFHENHVITETFSFNLLMGRNWPPEPEDLEAALEICRELGLSELLERLPAGFQQMVGESAWRLSHGEKSRLYIARALLQHADLMVLDESFAALDPENFELALSCVLNRASALVVIAHP
ncbi:MAG: ABC transporter ATP-binding protein [Candidatus Electrothrix aestuarii]|uniref:ABC transporter ATP-binding protein n=1 Tax=Candidatus Electrothrix aestuarii TaxID=3062594 RepID=A0AAU8LZ24_9BACT